MVKIKINLKRDVDQGYAWVILFAAFMLNVFMAGQFGCLGIFLLEYLHYFRTSKSPITWIGSCQMFIGYFLGIVSGALMKRFGCRVVSIVSSLMVFTGYLISAFFPYLPVLYVFYGALAGIGFLNFYLTAMVVVQHYFKKKRAFAAGVVMSGLSVGIFILPPLTRFLIDWYNWQGALIIEAAIFLNGVVFGALLRPVAEVKARRLRNISGKPLLQGDSQGDSQSMSEEAPDPVDPVDPVEPKKSRCQLFKRFPYRKFIGFYLFLIGYFCIQLGHMTIYTYTPVKGDALGISKSTVSFLVSLMGITGIFARPAVGIFGDCHFVNRTVLCGLSAALNGIVTMASSFLWTLYHWLYFPVCLESYHRATWLSMALPWWMLLDLVMLK